MQEDELTKEIRGIVYTAMHHAFNRSINALEEAGALNTEKMREQYNGVGSKYYDLVTEQIEHTAAQTNEPIEQVIKKYRTS